MISSSRPPRVLQERILEVLPTGLSTVERRVVNPEAVLLEIDAAFELGRAKNPAPFGGSTVP